ncbi:SPOR domain-containing protein [Propionivibrio dicarboxylicus]|uniref:DedD protein n=1 Tax=Propionivibrio dicarboxylicus TaxID=83767 RepID=A0A1G8MXZ4_9RHOO|nr:SPOR domain-containing protein [Propionivibrio dicarboxylicus]SDI72832.1 DedD protein [Propionivibrio dicarboxylicus]
MAASANPDTPSQSLSNLRRKLILRMGVAGLMIVGLLGGLALFDYMGARVESEPEATRYTEPVPVARKSITQPVKPIEPLPEVKEDKKETPAPETTSPPVDKSAPKLDVPPRPEVAARPALPKSGSGSTMRAASGPVSAPMHSSGASGPSSAPVKVFEPLPARAGAAMPTARNETGAAMPLPASPSRLFSGFALQAGVFTEPRRAEELHARLTLEGIPSTIEARVQVGPFNSKEEAEAARIKMKSMGIDAVMLMPSRLRR